MHGTRQRRRRRLTHRAQGARWAIPGETFGPYHGGVPVISMMTIDIGSPKGNPIETNSASTSGMPEYARVEGARGPFGDLAKTREGCSKRALGRSPGNRRFTTPRERLEGVN